MRKRILNYALKYNGNYQKMYQAIKLREYCEYSSYSGRYITIVDKKYPKSLFALKNPPFILFYKGDLSLLKNIGYGVIGSRNSTAYAEYWTDQFVKSVKESIVIISGLAKGIDSVAHKSAIKYNKQTIAVLGSGIEYVYPKENEKLYNKMKNNHLILSEYPLYTKPERHFFPFRNRIIAGLSNHLFVMQAGVKSGTLLTVNEALNLNKPISVLPYRLDEKSGYGCNSLIQQGANILMIEDIQLDKK